MSKSADKTRAIQQSVVRSQEKPVPSPAQVIPVVAQPKGAKSTQGLSMEQLMLLQNLKDRL